MSKSLYSLNPENKSVVKNDTGEEFFPSCYNDLSQYYSYICGTESNTEGQKVLKAVFKGEKVISNLIKYAQEHGKGLHE